MKLKNIAILALTLFALTACKKKNTPQKKDYFFTYKVHISKKIEEPTIISGYYGKVMEYEGNFQPAQDPVTGNSATPQPEPAQNEILVYTADKKEQIDGAAFQKDGITFYDLKKLKKAKVEPKYIITPNKSGFYQMDLGTGEFCVLLRVKKNKAYFNGGVRTLSATTGSLKELEMRVDYNASF